MTHLTALPSHTQGSEQLQFVTSTEYPAQVSYEEHRSSLIDLRLQQFPAITSYSPIQGSRGSTVYVYFQSEYNLLADPRPYITLMFGQKQCENAVLAQLEPRASHYQYELSTEVPPFVSTNWSSPAVPLQLVMSTPTIQEPKAVEVGTFTYVDQANHTPQSNPRKRKVSDGSEEIQRPTKRPSTQQLQIKDGDDYSGISYTPGGTSPYSPFLPTPTSGSMVYGGIGLSRAPTQSSYHQHPSPRQHMPQYSVSSTASQPSIKVPSPHTPTWSPSFATVNKAARSPMTPAGRPAPIQSPAKTANPPLIRTSTMQHSPSSSMSMPSTQSAQAFNPYAMYPHKAILKLNGDLESMVDQWGMDEWDAKRRLVEFTRRQTGNTIHAEFKATAPEDRTPQSICISCIYWEERKECYVTSVDTIYLLESLVAVRFTVEEKNRIRRNLEGFRPLTVSKAKPESEEFFKVIMGFPNPKPRNIEKDVKVFPWKILGHALKKIIGKYVSFSRYDLRLQTYLTYPKSASYSSTAGALHQANPGALLTPVSSSYASTEHSEAGNATHRATSPRSGSDSTSTSTYANSLTSTAISPRVQQLKQSPALLSVSGPPDLRVTVPTMAPPYASLPATHSYYPPPVSAQLSHPHGLGQQPLTAPVSRSPWDFATFVNTSPATAMPTTSQALHYSRVSTSVGPNQDYIPVSYSMSHQTSGA
jgi:hypothetical protein